MKPLIQKTLSSSIATLFGLCLATTASAQTLSQSPLEISTFVAPNVMLNLDDSLSMEQITFDSSYDNTLTYEQWQFNFNNAFHITHPINRAIGSYRGTNCASGTPDNVVRGDLDDKLDGFKWVLGQLGSQYRCIKVPAPEDGRITNTTNNRFNYSLYSPHYMQYLFERFSLNSGGDGSSGNPYKTDLTVDGTLANGDARPAISNETRLIALKNAAKLLIEDREEIRWCASELDHNPNNQNAGLLLTECADYSVEHFNALVAAIDGLDYNGITPVAESHFGIWEYFNASGGPVQYRCQQNYAMMVTDGLPNNDFAPGSNTLNNLPNTVSSRGTTLPNWDNLNVLADRDEVLNNNNIPAGSDGHFTYGEGTTLYLDDFALFAKEIDLKTTGVDQAGKDYANSSDSDQADNPFAHQNMNTYIIGLGIGNQMLDEAAQFGSVSGTGSAFKVANKADLLSALDTILSEIGNREGAAAAASATAAFLAGENQVFEVSYNSTDWTGELKSFTIDEQGELSDEPVWTTKDTLVAINGTEAPPRNALVVNRSTETPVELTWNNLSPVQRLQLRNDESLLDYILGERSEEIRSGNGDKRSRTGILGDIVHSQPVYVGTPNFGYSEESYETFLANTASRTPMVYVGANDGFIHGFDGTTTSSGGTEKLAFMPSQAITYLKDYDDRSYQHHYGIDGKNTLLDAQIRKGSDLEWATVLMSSMGAGGKGLFALDVTDPGRYDNLAQNGDDVFLWEISNTLPSDGGAVVENVALNGTATQSTTASGNGASRAIDGSTGTDSVTGTGNEEWLQVELQSSYAIEEIAVVKSGSGDLRDYSVFVSNESMNGFSYESLQLKQGVTEFRVDGTGSNTMTFNTENIPGKFVRVMRESLPAGSDKQLRIAELRVQAITNPSYPELGNIIDRPSIVRVGKNENEPSWYAITGNGVHSKSGHAVFYIVDLSTGEKLQEIVLDDTGNNGIVSHTAVDIDGDDYIDRVYLTDLKGNLWRINWDDANQEFVSEYTDGGSATPMFTATNTSSNVRQPITTAPEVLRFPGVSGALMVLFGAGKYYDVEDREVVDGEPDRSFYGVIDSGQNEANWTTLTKDELQSQEVLGTDVRAVTQNQVNFGAVSGWYLDLPSNGERVVFEPIAIRDRILFTTLIPPQPFLPNFDPCEPTVTGWLMEVDAFTGGSPDSVVFDINDDGDFSDTTDSVVIDGTTYQAAGIQPTAGAPIPPALVRVEPGPGSSQASTVDGIGRDSAGNTYRVKHESPIARTSWRRLN